jgi:BirA family biotin operon repressor/biotin-[acetyl-CoA-carboxylase] ligase
MSDYQLSTINHQLRGTIFVSGIHNHRTTDSTNKQAMHAAASGAPEGSVFTADEQTAGRGRGDHKWHSPAGQGLYASMLVRPQLGPSDALWLSLIAGLAVQAAIAHVTTISVDLRWPNDIMLREKKLGGILTELATESGRILHAVVGIGLNVNQPEFPPDLRQTATSLRIETDLEWSRDDLLIALLTAFDREYKALLIDSNARRSIVERFEKLSSYARNAQVEVDDHGAAQFSGVTEGLDERGFLRVRTSEGMRTVFSGGVRKVRG